MTMIGAPSFAFDLVQGGLLLLSVSLVTLIHAHTIPGASDSG